MKLTLWSQRSRLLQLLLVSLVWFWYIPVLQANIEKSLEKVLTIVMERARKRDKLEDMQTQQYRERAEEGEW